MILSVNAYLILFWSDSTEYKCFYKQANPVGEATIGMVNTPSYLMPINQ